MEVGKGGVEALTSARVQLAEGRVPVDEQDWVVGCNLGYGGEAAGAGIESSCCKSSSKKNYHRLCCETDWVAAVRGVAGRTIYTKARQTRRYPTHNRHKTFGSLAWLGHV
jgi:hypothetical protein